ncbi:MAG: hypothetical protein HY278_04810 [candidate division NC10 bacterium]|nr:hypothetical protein [candidate division NC10 bacterium]
MMDGSRSRWGIRGNLIASMMATLIPLLALSLFRSYRELQSEQSKIRLETLRFVNSGATVDNEFVTTTELALMTLAEAPSVKAKDRRRLDPLVKRLQPKFLYLMNLVVVDERGNLFAAAIGAQPRQRLSFAPPLPL